MVRALRVLSLATMKTNARVISLLSLPTLLLILGVLFPFAALMLFSFRVESFDASAGYTLDRYLEFFSRPNYLRVLGSTAVTASWVALLAVIFAYPVAWFLAFKAGQRKITLMALIIAPAWTGYLLRILAWKVILGSSGLLSSFLEGIGVSTENFGLLLYSPQAVVITLVYVWIPFAALPIFVSLERIDRRLFESAADLGATPLQTFWRVILPLSLPGVLGSFLYVFIPTFGDWVTPLLVGGAQGGILYGNLIQSQFTRGLDWPMGSVLSLMLVLVVGMVLLAYNRIAARLVGGR